MIKIIIIIIIIIIDLYSVVRSYSEELAAGNVSVLGISTYLSVCKLNIFQQTANTKFGWKSEIRNFGRNC